MSKSAPNQVQSWLVMAGCILGLTASVGPVFLYSFAVFIQPMSASLGWSRGQLSILYALANLAVAVAAPLVGNLVRRYGGLRVLQTSSVSLALLFATIMAAPADIRLFGLIFFLIGAVGSGTQTFVYLGFVARQFQERLGLMLGIAMTGIGLGQFVAPIYATYLIETIGWRSAYAALGLSGLVITSLALILLPTGRHNPDLKFATPASFQQEQSGMTAAAAARTSQFWLLGACFVAVSAAASGTAVHFVAILGDLGASPAEAAAILATAGIAVGLSRLIGGYLLDHIGPYTVGSTVFFGAACAIAALILPVEREYLVIVPLLLGCALGIEGDLMPYLARRIYGMLDYDRIYSRFFAFFSAGVVIGPLLVGLMYDRFGIYRPPLVVLFLFSLFAAAALGLTRWSLGKATRASRLPDDPGQPS